MPYNQYKESFILLMESCKKAIPFNVLLGLLVSVNLIYNQVPYAVIGTWFLGIVIISVTRYIFCYITLKHKHSRIQQHTVYRFNLLTAVAGLIWTLCYFITLPYLSELNEFIIILVLGGMCAGSVAALSSNLSTYYAYVIPMFAPVISYNYLQFQPDRVLLATMFFLFVLMLMISAKINNKLLDDNFYLSHEKDKLIHDLKIISITDSLTGLYNRRHFQNVLPQELHNAKHVKHSLNLISIDVDNFKLINDNFGHPNGDKFLIEIGKIMQMTCKKTNTLLFRLGGDEFSAILINKTLKQTLNMCESINQHFKNNLIRRHYDLEPSVLEQITLSMGIVNIHFKCSLKLDHVITIVDKALYQAKKQGKNQIIVKKIH